jgi:hypothetical protein
MVAGCPSAFAVWHGMIIKARHIIFYTWQQQHREQVDNFFKHSKQSSINYLSVMV